MPAEPLLHNDATIEAEGTQFQSENLRSTKGGILRPINLPTKVAQRGHQEERQQNTEEGKRVAVSQRTDSAVIPLVKNLALHSGAHNPDALEQETAQRAPPVHSEGVNIAQSQTVRTLLRTKDRLITSSLARVVGDRVTPSLPKLCSERPLLGEQVEVRTRMFAHSLLPT